MIKVILRDKEIIGDWDSYSVRKEVIPSGACIATYLELKGREGTANFKWDEVVAWFQADSFDTVPMVPESPVVDKATTDIVKDIEVKGKKV